MENLDLLSLRTLVLFHDLGSLAMAANRVGRTQAAASLQLKRLEGQLGLPLFEKKGRQLHLNSSGLRLLEQAREMIRLNDEALASVRNRLAGTITLGLTQDLADGWLLPILNHFRLRHPDVQINVHVDRNYQLQKAESAGKLDLAIIAGKATSRGAEGCIRVPMVWISREKAQILSLKPGKKPLQLILFEDPCLFRDAAIRSLKKAQIPFEISFTSSSLAAIWSAVRAGLGVTVRSTLAVPKDLVIVERLQREPALGNVQFNLVRSSQIKGPAVSSLHQELSNVLRQHQISRGRPSEMAAP
jgi:DNA-binding transcriptional LysR family regulator